MPEQIHLCDSFARLGKPLQGCRSEVSEAAGRARQLLLPSGKMLGDENAHPEYHQLPSSTAADFRLQGIGDVHVLRVHGRAGPCRLLSFQELPLERLLREEQGQQSDLKGGCHGKAPVVLLRTSGHEAPFFLPGHGLSKVGETSSFSARNSLAPPRKGNFMLSRPQERQAQAISILIPMLWHEPQG